MDFMVEFKLSFCC